MDAGEARKFRLLEALMNFDKSQLGFVLPKGSRLWRAGHILPLKRVRLFCSRKSVNWAIGADYLSDNFNIEVGSREI